MADSEEGGDNEPYVSERSDFLELQAFYESGEDNAVFLSKLEEIKATHSAMRKVKGDGNCFYRAYMFAIYESVLAKPDEAKAILQQFKAFYEKMIAPDGLGYQADAIEMFYEDAVKPLELISQGAAYDSRALVQAFCEYASSNAIVMFARLICSCHLQQQEEMFAPFLAADGLTVKEFVHREVEPLDKEVEQIQIMALCQAMDIPLKVAYLDRSVGTLNFHDILDSHPKAAAALCMLYRPGHYDLIYAA